MEPARAAPDGYTIGVATQGTLVFNQGIRAKTGYDSQKDFAPIALLGRASNVMVVHTGNAASAPADIIAMARSGPTTITFSSGGSGTSHHLSGVLFALDASRICETDRRRCDALGPRDKSVRRECRLTDVRHRFAS